MGHGHVLVIARLTLGIQFTSDIHKESGAMRVVYSKVLDHVERTWPVVLKVGVASKLRCLFVNVNVLI